MAKVGYKRVQESEDPELATRRTKEIYRAKGYSENWIEKRMRGIAVRTELTDEWQNRGIKESPEYAILTSEISKLGEAATTEITRKQDAQGFGENKVTSQKGEKIAGNARHKLEIETGSRVVNSDNYLTEPESQNG